ncbi:MAG TPA: DNA-formamidopyrimidine glycosylase [Caldithrix abyssi]|uniref:Formamidopyrimidine-DNA glycosylase n=1 Tax=Caldithrix abyssi TaxID=187145 RepID=A0A7V5VEW3_CALAY|nr:DNA-formamidopyrimidine glycosylase [Caldithrix abyssi]
MPELPEVETVARELRAALPGRAIKSAEVYWNKTFEARSSRKVDGQSVKGVGRKGKYLIVELDAGAMVIHLRMTGQLLIQEKAQEAPHPHDRMSFLLDNGSRLVFRDARKFGRVYLVDEARTIVGKIGTDAMDKALTAGDFAAMLKKSAMNIKAFLLSQKYISGLGNIYVDEALFLSGIHPKTMARNIGRPQNLFDNIRLVLQRSIDNMGSTISDYRNTKGNEGKNQLYFNVYSRRGQSCKRCGQTIEKITVAGRGTHFCPRCQQEEKR